MHTSRGSVRRNKPVAMHKELGRGSEEATSLDTIGELEGKWQYRFDSSVNRNIIRKWAVASSANFSPVPPSFSARVSQVEIRTVLIAGHIYAFPK